MTAEILQLAREVKLIRTGLPLDELARRARLIEQLENQLGNVKDDVFKAGEAAKGAASEAKQATKTANTLRGQLEREVKRFGTEIDKATKPLQDAYKKVDGGVQRLTKGLDKFGAAAGIGFGLAGVVISFAALWQSEANQAAFDRQVDAFQTDLSNQGSFNQLIQNRFKKLREDFEAYKKKSEKTFDYQSQDIKQARRIADSARKLANDITYEARVKIRKLNDIAAQANSNASKALVQNTALRTSVTAVNSTIKTVQTSIKTVDTKVKTAEIKADKALAEASTARTGVRLVDSKASTALATAQQLPAKIPALVAPAVQAAITPLKAQVQQAQKAADNAIAQNSPQDRRITALESRVTAITTKPTVNAPTSDSLTVTQAVVNRAIVNSGVYQRLGAAEAAAAAAVKIASAPKIEPIGNQALSLGTNNAAAINKLSQDIQQLKAPNLLEPRLQAVETKVREREAVDVAANQKLDKLVQDRSKLDQLLTLAVAIPLIAPNVVSGISSTLSPQIQRLPGDTAAAVAAAPCNGKGCGGKTAARVDGIADEVNALKNQVSGIPNAVNTFNTGANAGQLLLLQRIDQTTQGITGKLGSLLPNGGIGGILSRIAKSSAVDKALQVATFIGVMHNAFNISADLGRSFFSLSSSAINATLRTMGVTTADDSPIDVGAIISGQIEAQIKALIGVENWTQMNRALASANRIYQAGSNVVSSVWSMHDSTQNVLEYTASNTGKIGNALKRDRVIAQDAFPDMSERVTARSTRQRKLDDIVDGISDLSSGVSALDSVFQEVVNINDTVVEYKRSTEELNKSIKESPIPVVAENLAVKAKRQAESVASKSPESISEVAREAAEV
jgi:hypothetical protein